MALDFTDTRDGLVEMDLGKGSFRVHRDAYLSPEVFEREKKLIFDRCWLYLGHASEIAKPGAFVTRKVADRELIFVRDKSGQPAAFHNNCTHRGARICREPSGTARNFSCPYHGWVFNTEGKLLSMNTDKGFAEGINDDGRLDLLRAPRLEQYRDLYFVNFNPRAVSLSDFLAGAKDAIDGICDQAETEMIVLPGEHTYSVRANYKFMCENSYDGYHVGPVHASYLDYLRDRLAGTEAASLLDDTLNDYDSTGAVDGLGNGHGLLYSYLPTGRPCAQWLPGMPQHMKAPIEAKFARLVEKFGEERARYIGITQKNLVIFPNLVINDGVAATIRYVEPEGHGRMRISAWAFAPAEETPEMKAMRLDNFISFLGPAGFGSPDDIEMLEMCQESSDRSPIQWSEMSKGLDADPDRRHAHGGPSDEVQMQAYWQQWDLMMRDVETLEG